jgi:hypothetical protein
MLNLAQFLSENLLSTCAGDFPHRVLRQHVQDEEKGYFSKTA